MAEENKSQRNHRIAKNTALLYVRTLISVVVSLYTARVVINALGVEDYGLYNVVGGVVAILSFLPGTMASATQRFFSHALGKKDQIKLNQIFGVNTLIYAGIAVIALLLLVTSGEWFVSERLSIPVGRADAVLRVFHLATIAFVISIFQSPFMAMIVAHEDMAIYAYVAIMDAVMRLAIVFLIVHLQGDKIVVYSWLLLVVTIIQTGVYLVICFRKYQECDWSHIRWNKKLAREITGFTWWTLFGQLTTIARTAAVTILLNQYFTPAVVAARAIASNIASQSNLLATQFNTSLYPPIIKAYAAEKREEMYQLVINGSKITFFLMWILALPLFTGMELILELWLGTVPEYTVSFAKLTLIEGMIFAVSLPMTTAARAPGKMAAYELILGTLQFSILFVSWFILHNGGEPDTVFYTTISVNLIMFFVRLVIVSRLTGLSVLLFLKGTLPSIGLVVIASSGIALLLSMIITNNITGCFVKISTAFISSCVLIYIFGISAYDKKKLNELVKSKIESVKK